MKALCLLSLVPICVGATSIADFPVIDLGYARHAPTFINTTVGSNISYATYRNIRFAQPPTGDLRFKKPVTPPPASEGIQDGVVPLNSTNCLQTWPVGQTTPPGMNGSTWGSEDCLFLDVIIPEGATLPAAAGTGLPVLHWVYGGGYFYGAKEWAGNPWGILESINPDEKFIVVASNYRLGPLGWMSSDTEPSMAANAGLYDTVAALEWTRDFIYRFGGDPDKVTVMGQSAGSGQLHHLLAADAQGRRMPFNQAILSSPGYRPHVNRSKEMTEIYDMILKFTGCDDVACLRKLSAEEMRKANEYYMLDAPQGNFGGPSIGPGPIIDGDVVLDIPDRIFNATSCNKGQISRVISGGMASEGVGYNNLTWSAFVKYFARTPSQSTIETIRSMYPSPKNQSVSPTGFDRLYSEIIFDCHSYFADTFYASGKGQELHLGKPTESYRYSMSIPPAVHGQDLQYYFYDKSVAAVDPSVVVPVATKFQHYLREFIMGREMQGWPEYHSAGAETPSWIDLNTKRIDAVTGGKEVGLAERCETLLELFDNPEDGW